MVSLSVGLIPAGLGLGLRGYDLLQQSSKRLELIRVKISRVRIKIRIKVKIKTRVKFKIKVKIRIRIMIRINLQQGLKKLAGLGRF